jgi:glucose/arabinose dehydrogenase
MLNRTTWPLVVVATAALACAKKPGAHGPGGAVGAGGRGAATGTAGKGDNGDQGGGGGTTLGAGGGTGDASGQGAAGGGAPAAVGDPCRGVALPPGEHYVAPGLCASTVATGQGALRQISFSSNGDLWGVTAEGQIRRFRDADGDGAFQGGEIVDWATTDGNGQNVHIDEVAGYLYSGTPIGVRGWSWSNAIDAGGAGQDILVDQPSSGGHAKHTVHVWDGWMYVQSGSSDNVSDPKAPSYDDQRSLVKRFKLASLAAGKPFSWITDGEIFADGLRNTLGFNRDAAGRIYGVQNGQDDVTYVGLDVHNENPGEVVVRLEAGSHHGYPFCFVVQRIDDIAPGTQVRSQIFPGNTHDDAWCQDPTNAARPVTFLSAHNAPMDIVFFTTEPTGALPERWRGGAFISLHGSWDRSPASGYRVVWEPFNPDGTAPLPKTVAGTTVFPHEVVLSGGTSAGSQEGPWNVSGGEQNVRPVGLAVSPLDGALYISSDTQGYVYRVGLRR